MAKTVWVWHNEPPGRASLLSEASPQYRGTNDTLHVGPDTADSFLDNGSLGLKLPLCP